MSTTVVNYLENMELPHVLITSLQSNKAKEIANNLGATFLCQKDDTGVYLLDIDNKYYTAQVVLCTKDNLLIKPSTFEALIFYYDLKTENCLHLLDEQVSPLISQTTADILLLVCDSVPSDIRDKAVEWCISKKFELVELLLLDDDGVDDEDNLSKFGIDRVQEVLEAHMWPNVNLKSVVLNKETQKQPNEVEEIRDGLENVQLNNSENFSEHLHMQSILDHVTDSGEADFGELLSQLKEIKDHAKSMPSNQRKDVAEQVVTAFWKAIGGNPSEIEDVN